MQTKDRGFKIYSYFLDLGVFLVPHAHVTNRLNYVIIIQLRKNNKKNKIVCES